MLNESIHENNNNKSIVVIIKKKGVEGGKDVRHRTSTMNVKVKGALNFGETQTSVGRGGDVIPAPMD